MPKKAELGVFSGSEHHTTGGLAKFAPFRMLVKQSPVVKANFAKPP